MSSQDNLINQLQVLPEYWGLVAVGANKRPYQDGWQGSPLTRAGACAEIRAGRARAVGVLAGPASCGLLFVDHDGISATEEMERLGVPKSELPPTVGFTSGKDGRFQLAFLVPEQYWDSMRGRRVFKTGKLDAAGKAENLDFRWTGHQSIVIGEHPETSGYRWLEGRSPSQVQVAEAPLAMIELMLREPEPEAKAPQLRLVLDGAGGAVPLLDFVTRGSRELVEGGGTPGSWNDDQLVLALDLVGTEAWLVQQGLQPDMTARDAFELHIQAARGKAKDFSERKAWQRFDGAAGRNPSPGTPEDKLLERAAYHTRPERGERRREAVPPGPPEASEPPEPPGPPAAGGDREPLDQIPITCLGFSGDDYFYQSHDSGQVTRISKAAHSSSTSLIGLADLSVWEQAYPRYNGEGEIIGVSWKIAVNDLFRKQHRVGVFDPSRIRGVGAWIDNGRHVFHLGDRLLVDGVEHSVFDPPASRYLYQRHSRRIGPGAAEPLKAAQGIEIIAMAERFHWEEPISGTLLAGWIALAPICGALDWRPHIWLQAVAGSGKTTVLNRFVSPLLSDLRLNVMGCTTEAGIRQKLKCDAIPVVFDESESNQKRDAERIQSVLALARIASSESDSVALKGSAGGDSIQFSIRSMFLLSSIATALRQGADESRFCVLTLRIPDGLSKEARDQQWRQLDADLIGAITPELGMALAARMIQMIPVVRAATRTFARVAAVELGGSRAGDQVGALLAGAWALWNDNPPSEDQAVALIRSSDWAERKQQAQEEGGDQRACLDLILQSRLRVEVDKQASVSRTVWELIEVASGFSGPLDQISPASAQAELGRNGIRVEDGAVWISNTAKGIQAMLRDTPWAEKGWANMLAALPNAVKGGTVRFKGLASPTRCVILPKSLVAPGESAS